MAVKIRLKRMGRRNRPFYRLIAIDSKKRREGLEIERLGWYNPLNQGLSYKLNEDRVLYWLKEGAQASEATKGIFKRSGLSYKWHLINQGVKENEIDSLMEEWKKNQDQREKLKIERKKVKKTEASLSAETDAEAAAEEPAAEEPAEKKTKSKEKSNKKSKE